MAEVEGHATAPAADESLPLDVAHGCSSSWADFLLRDCPLQLDQVSVFQTLQSRAMFNVDLQAKRNAARVPTVQVSKHSKATRLHL